MQNCCVRDTYSRPSYTKPSTAPSFILNTQPHLTGLEA